MINAHKEFALNLFTLTKQAKVITASWVALSIAFTSLVIGLRGTGRPEVFYLVFAPVLAGSVWAYRLYKKAVIVPSIVVVAPAEIQVWDARQNKLTLAVAYASLASYRYQSFNGTEELRLTLRNTDKLRVKANTNLTQVGDFAGMVQCLEQQLAAVTAATAQLPENQVAAVPQVLITREKSFFEKPISSVGLAIFTLLLGLIVWRVATGLLPFKANFLLIAGIYLAYLAAWRAAATRRNEF